MRARALLARWCIRIGDATVDPDDDRWHWYNWIGYYLEKLGLWILG